MMVSQSGTMIGTMIEMVSFWFGMGEEQQLVEVLLLLLLLRMLETENGQEDWDSISSAEFPSDPPLCMRTIDEE